MTTLAVDDTNMDGFVLSITSRATEDTTPAMLEELTYRTIKSWLWIVQDGLEKGIYKLPLDPETKGLLGSVESRYAADLNKAVDTDAPPKAPFAFEQQFGDARVTVWATFRGTNKFKFHLNSDDIPQVAVDTWLANNRAIARIEKERGGSTEKARQDAPATAPAQQTAERPATTKNAPVAPPQAVEGAIVATRAPNSKRPDYANGQLVAFTVTKIVASSNKGSAVYQMWTPLGSQYPTISVYKFKPNSQDLKPDYEAIVPILNNLNLSLDKPEAMGTWRLICRAAHVPNKETNADLEYLNVVSLTAI